jgi:hypothetical protein
MEQKRSFLVDAKNVKSKIARSIKIQNVCSVFVHVLAEINLLRFKQQTLLQFRPEGSSLALNFTCSVSFLYLWIQR